MNLRLATPEARAAISRGVWLVRESFAPGVRFDGDNGDPNSIVFIWTAKPDRIEHLRSGVLVAWRVPIAYRTYEHRLADDRHNFGFCTLQQCKLIFGVAPDNDRECIRIGR